MDDHNSLLPRELSNGAQIDSLVPRTPFTTLDMMPREPHLLDYLVVLRKHQWLILSFLLAVVTIVTIATYRMPPVYEATARIMIDRENTNVLPFNGTANDEMYEDFEEYIGTQSKILTSATLAQQTI